MNFIVKSPWMNLNSIKFKHEKNHDYEQNLIVFKEKWIKKYFS